MGGGGGSGDGDIDAGSVAEDDFVELSWLDSVVLDGGTGATKDFVDAENVFVDEDGGLELPMLESLDEDLKYVWNEDEVCTFGVEDAWDEEGGIDEVETLLLGRAQVPPSWRLIRSSYSFHSSSSASATSLPLNKRISLPVAAIDRLIDVKGSSCLADAGHVSL